MGEGGVEKKTWDVPRSGKKQKGGGHLVLVSQKGGHKGDSLGVSLRVEGVYEDYTKKERLEGTGRP